MAEMLVRTVDRTNATDPRKNAQLTKRGDVIVIMPDGHPWTARERSDPWIIVKVPGVDPADLTAFVTEEPDDGTPKLRQARAFGFNLTAYLKSPHLADGLTLALALAFKIGKPPIPDPNVL